MFPPSGPYFPVTSFHKTSQSSLSWHQHLSPATRSDELSTFPSSIVLRSPSGISLSQAVSRPSHQQASPVSRPPDVTPATPLNVGWTSYHQQHPEIDPHALRPDQDIRTPPSKAKLANMSAVASLQFDPVFSRGGRSSFNSWLGLENNDTAASYLAHNLSSLGPASDTSITPPLASRSITSSPPRASFTPQQREHKRQRDQMRRDSKTTARVQRGSINPYLSSPPLSVVDVTAAMGVPVYSTAPSSAPLLSEPVTTMATSSYLPSYSPPVQEPAYSDGFQSLPAAYSLGVDYSAQFPGPAPYERSPPLSMGDQPMMYGVTPSVSSSASPPSEHSHVRVVQSRPKPQCWEHGCNGRQFSTFSNLLRHQREKSGQAAKASCPNCGAEFTRTTARNGHLLHDKCKQRRSS